MKDTSPSFLQNTEMENKFLLIQIKESIYSDKLEYLISEKGTNNFKKIENIFKDDKKFVLGTLFTNPENIHSSLSESIFNIVPKRVLMNLFRYLDLKSFSRVANCCKYFYFLSNEMDSSYWKNLAFSFHKKIESLIKEENMHIKNALYAPRACIDRLIEEKSKEYNVFHKTWNKRTKILGKHLKHFKIFDECPMVLELGEGMLFFYYSVFIRLFEK